MAAMPNTVVTPRAARLPEPIRAALGLDANATAAVALTAAEARLKQVLEKLQKLPEDDTSQPELKKEGERLERVVRELRAIIANDQAENPLLNLEKLMDEGMTCFLQTPPDLANAERYYAAVEQESAGKTLPDALRGRMQFFRTALDRLRKDVVRARVDRILKEVNSLLGAKPPNIRLAREKLAAADAMLKDAPDAQLRHEWDSLTGEVQRFEHITVRKAVENPKLRELRVQLATRVRFRIRHDSLDTVREVKALQFLIGRGSQGEDASLDLGFDLRCSRRHARVWSEGGFFWIEDLGSKFGTKLDGEEIKGAGRRHLKPQAKVQIGDTLLTLLEDDTAVSPFQPLPAQSPAKSEVEIDSSLNAEVTILRGAKGESEESFLQRQSWLLELHLELAAQRNLTDLLTLILQRAIAAISGAARGAVLLRSTDSDALLLAAYVSDGEPPVSETLARKAIKEAAAFMWRRNADVDPAESIRRLSIESGIYAPMIREGRATTSTAACARSIEMPG